MHQCFEKDHVLKPKDVKLCTFFLFSITKMLMIFDSRMTSEDAKAITVRLGDHNLDDPTDSVTVEKSVKLIVRNKLFSMQTLVKDLQI